MRSEESILIDVKDYLDDLEKSLGELFASVSEGHVHRSEAIKAEAMESLAEARRVIVLRVSEIGRGKT